MIKPTSILATLPVLILCLGCPRSPNVALPDGEALPSIQIEGSLEEGAGKMVLLEEMGAREYIPLDTVYCDENGSFLFDMAAEQLAFYVLRYGDSGYNTLLLEPGERVNFRGHISDRDVYTIHGSEGSELLRRLAVEHKKTLDALSLISRKNRNELSSDDYSRIKVMLDQQFDSLTTSFRNYSLDFIHQYSSSPAILVALYNLYGPGLPVFRPETDFKVYQFVDSALMLCYSGMEAVDLLHAQVSQVVQSAASESILEPLQVGEIAPDFVSSRPDGQQMALSDLRGNYVVLNFWAGWSRLSRVENISLRKAYERFHQEAFDIFQVSLDDQRTQWLDAIKEDSLNWEHVSDLRRWETLVVDLYHVDKIPTSILIDPEGRIIETDLLNERLLDKLSTIFSK